MVLSTMGMTSLFPYSSDVGDGINPNPDIDVLQNDALGRHNIPTDELVYEDTTTDTHTGDINFTKMKEVKLGGTAAGTLRIKYDLSGFGVGGLNDVRGYIYKNGVLQGDQDFSSSEAVANCAATTPVTHSIDSTGWEDGDLLQIYCKVTAPGTTLCCSNLRIYASGCINCWFEFDKQ